MDPDYRVETGTCTKTEAFEEKVSAGEESAPDISQPQAAEERLLTLEAQLAELHELQALAGSGSPPATR